MNKCISTYLNLLRVLATFLVFIGHFSYNQFTGNSIKFIGRFSHDAVIIFFVLSGYVIAYVSKTKDNNFKDYLCSRFSRIYSVLIPAMILTILLDNIGILFNDFIYANYNYTAFNYISNIFSTLLCCQEIGPLSIRYFSNGPIWSLGYEFIYYIMYGFLYYKPKSLKIKLLVIIMFLSFYKVTVLFPVWLLGVLAYKKDFKLNKKYSKIIFFITPALFLLLKFFNILTLIDIYSLGYSRYFIGDYIIGLLLFLNIIALKNLDFKFNYKIDSISKKLANFSFSVYLYHFPLLLFNVSILNYDASNFIEILLIGILTLFSCYLLSIITENKKYILKNYLKTAFKLKPQFKVKEFI